MAWLLPYFKINHILGIYINISANTFIFKIVALLLSMVLFGWFYIRIDWKKIEKFVAKNEKWVLIGIISAISALFMTITFNLHLHFNTHTFDLGIYDRTAWFYGRFQFGYFENIVNMKKMADHFEPILMIPGLFYWIFKTPYILLAFEAIVVAFGFLPVYLIAKKLLKSRIAAIFMGMGFVFFMGVLKAVEFPVHPGTYLATFYGFMLYFALEKKFKWYYLFLLLALFSKESAALHLFYIGFFLTVFLKEKKHGLITMATGVLWYVLIIKMIMPELNGGQPYVHGVFSNISNDPKELIKFIVLHPIDTLQIMFDQPVKAQTFWLTLASSGFLVLLSPVFILLVFPMLFERLVTEHSGMITMQFHYGIPIAIMLFFSTIWSIKWLAGKIKRENAVIYLAGYVFLCSFLVPVRFGSPLVVFKSWNNFKLRPIDRSGYEILKSVPKNASVLAQESLVPHLSYREKIGMYPGNPAEYEYILLSKDKDFPSWPVTGEIVSSGIHELRDNKLFQVEKENQYFVLFKRR